jgi:hypothetical protein
MRIILAERRIANAGWREVKREQFAVEYARGRDSLTLLLCSDDGSQGPGVVPTVVAGTIRDGHSYNSFSTAIS